MAYTTYTPTATAFTDVDLPDDSELETSGIGAMDTPMETVADGLLWATDAADVTINNAAALDVYTTVFTVDSATMTSYTDVTAANGAVADVSITVPAGNATGVHKIVVTFEFTVNTATGTGCFIDVFSSGTAAEVPNTESFFTDATALNLHTSISFAVSATVAAVTYTLRAKCATNTCLIYGPVRMHAVRVRES